VRLQMVFKTLAKYAARSRNLGKSKYRTFIARLGSEYELPRDRCLLEGTARRLVDAFGDLRQVEGRSVLDLGCGSTSSRESRANNRVFEPWLCRAVALLGGTAVGIDVGFSGQMPPTGFTYQRLCLLFDTNRLSQLLPTPQSFDAIHMNLLLSSPTLAFQHSREARSAMRDALRLQRDRLLKPDGIIIGWDENLDSW